MAAPPCSCWETAGLGLRSNPPPPFVKMGARREDTVLPGTGAQHRVDVIPRKQSGSRQASSRLGRGDRGSGGGAEGCFTRPPGRTHVRRDSRLERPSLRLPSRGPEATRGKGEEKQCGRGSPPADTPTPTLAGPSIPACQHPPVRGHSPPLTVRGAVGWAGVPQKPIGDGGGQVQPDAGEHGRRTDIHDQPSA